MNNQDLINLAQAIQWLSPTPEIDMSDQDNIEFALDDGLNETEIPISAMYHIASDIPLFRYQCLNALHRSGNNPDALEAFIVNWVTDTIGIEIETSGETLYGLKTPAMGFCLEDEISPKEEQALLFILNTPDSPPQPLPQIPENQLPLIDPNQAMQPAHTTPLVTNIKYLQLKDIWNDALGYEETWDEEDEEYEEDEGYEEGEKEEKDQKHKRTDSRCYTQIPYYYTPNLEEPAPKDPSRPILTSGQFLHEKEKDHWRAKITLAATNFQEIAYLLFHSSQRPTVPLEWQQVGAAIGWLFAVTGNETIDNNQWEDENYGVTRDLPWADWELVQTIIQEAEELFQKAKIGIELIVNSLYIQQTLRQVIFNARLLKEKHKDYAQQHLDELEWPTSTNASPRPTTRHTHAI